MKVCSPHTPEGSAAGAGRQRPTAMLPQRGRHHLGQRNYPLVHSPLVRSPLVRIARNLPGSADTRVHHHAPMPERRASLSRMRADLRVPPGVSASEPIDERLPVEERRLSAWGGSVGGGGGSEGGGGMGSA